MFLIYHMRAWQIEFSVITVTTLCLALAVSSCASALPFDIGKSVEKIAEQKSKAEQYASEIIRLHSEKKLLDQNYNRARVLYINAKGAFDGWLERLQLALEQGESLDSPDYETSLKNAADKGTQFISFAEGIISASQERGGVAVFDILSALKDGGIEIWKEYRASDQKRKEALLKRLDALKWRPLS